MKLAPTGGGRDGPRLQRGLPADVAFLIAGLGPTVDRTLNYGIHGTFLLMGNAGFISSTVVCHLGLVGNQMFGTWGSEVFVQDFGSRI